MPVDKFLKNISTSRQKVFDARSKRIRPGLDNKILTSWNALMLKGLCDAYRAFSKTEYLDIALKNASFLLGNIINDKGRISRVYAPRASFRPSLKDRGTDPVLSITPHAALSKGEGSEALIKGPDQKVLSTDSYRGGEDLGEAAVSIAFLDDYANLIDAFIALYEVTFNEEWLMQAKRLTDMAIEHYYDTEKGIFFYTADDDEQLIARKSEIMDGVTPASNSVMARNLKRLGLLFDNQNYLSISAQLLRNIVPHLARYGSSYANWIMLLTEEIAGTYEIAITGNDYEETRREIEKSYIPNKIILGGNKGTLPLLKDKFREETQIFICKNKTCGLPVQTVDRCA